MNVNDEFDPARAGDDGPDLPPLSAEDEARVRAALAGLGPADLSAREAFRASLRARFVDGSITAPVSAPVGAVPAPIAPRRPRVIRPWAAALAAAALLAVAVFAWMPWPAREAAPVPAWTVIAMTADSTAGSTPIVEIDGRALALAALSASTVAPGARIALPPGVAIELHFTGELALETAPGTTFTVPTAGPRRVATVDHGEVRYVTGPRFAGTRLTVESPEARVEVTGTAFVVIAAPQMTCVCVGEGAVRVAARGAVADSTAASSQSIAAGSRREIYADGTMSEELTVHAHEAELLAGLRARMAAAKSP